MAESEVTAKRTMNVADFIDRHQSGQFHEPIEGSSCFEVDGCVNHDWLACGWKQSIPLVLRGDVGDFALSGASDVDCSVQGNVGHNFGCAMVSGNASVSGSAGDALMSFARGGIVVLKGNAGRRVGCGMQGGDAIIVGSVGLQAAFEMRSGTIIIGGSVGPMLGLGAKGGTIYVNGKVSTVAPDVEEDRMRDADRLKLSLLLLKGGLELSSTSWRVFRAVSRRT